MDSQSPTLTALLPSTPYTLAYALPLLLLSLLITFGGTFLTLDRTRSFPKSKGYAAIPAPGGFDLAKKKPSKFVWQLQGGVGGLSGGYVFGLHFSTALGLLIPATTDSTALSPKAFLAVWIISCAVTTWLASRYRFVALGFYGMSGGTLFALALCVILHPSLPSRVILVAVFMPLFFIIVALASVIPRLVFTTLHPFLRLCTASTGAFGIVSSISLLSNPPVQQWANVWERLWMKDGDGWGSSREQGLSAAFGVFVAVGCLADWALRRWIGDCPDEKWDKYLAQYAANLPNQADRAGTFQPLSSFWDRIFGPPASAREIPLPRSAKASKDPDSKEIIFPSDADMKSKSKSLSTPLPLPVNVSMNNLSAGKLSKTTPETGAAFTPGKDLLKKKSKKHRKGWFGRHGDEDDDSDEGVVDPEGGRRRGRKKRKPLKFGAVDDLSSDSSADEDEKGVTSPLSPSARSPTQPASSPEILQHPIGKKPPTRQSTGDPLSRTHSSSTPTLVDGEVPDGGKDKHPKFITSDNRKRSYQDEAHQYVNGMGVALEALDYDAEIARLKQMRRREGREGSETFRIGEEYSDYEGESKAILKGGVGKRRQTMPSTAGAVAGKGAPNPPPPRTQRRLTQPPASWSDESEQPQWTPGFIERHQSTSGAAPSAPPAALPPPTRRMTNSSRAQSRADRDDDHGDLDEEALLQPPPGTFVPVPVPATPSLIKALDRIRVAQEEVYGVDTSGGGGGGAAHDRRRPTRHQSQSQSQPRWDEFWREVKTKAADS